MKVIRRCFFLTFVAAYNLEKRTYDIALYYSVSFIVEDGYHPAAHIEGGLSRGPTGEAVASSFLLRENENEEGAPQVLNQLLRSFQRMSMSRKGRWRHRNTVGNLSTMQN